MVIIAAAIFILILECVISFTKVESHEACWRRNGAPPVFYINLNSSTGRNKHISTHLNKLGFTQVMRVPAFTPEELFAEEVALLSSSPSPNSTVDNKVVHKQKKGKLSYGATLPSNVKKLISVTASHLEAIYQAYVLTSSTPSPSSPPLTVTVNGITYNLPRHALILEDDVEILLPPKDWTSLIAFAPQNWTFLQLVTSNKAALITLREMWPNRTSDHHSPHTNNFHGIIKTQTHADHNIAMRYDGGGMWLPYKFSHDDQVGRNGLMWLRRNNQVWGAGAYLVNLDNLRHLFDNSTYSERVSRSTRFNPTPTFLDRCDHTKTSIGARLRCAGKIKYYADKFIYELGGRDNAYICTIPFVNFLPHVTSLMSWQHKGVQHQASVTIQSMSNELIRGASGGNKTWFLPHFLGCDSS